MNSGSCSQMTSSCKWPIGLDCGFVKHCLNFLFKTADPKILPFPKIRIDGAGPRKQKI